MKAAEAQKIADDLNGRIFFNARTLGDEDQTAPIHVKTEDGQVVDGVFECKDGFADKYERNFTNGGEYVKPEDLARVCALGTRYARRGILGQPTGWMEHVVKNIGGYPFGAVVRKENGVPMQSMSDDNANPLPKTFADMKNWDIDFPNFPSILSYSWNYLYEITELPNSFNPPRPDLPNTKSTGLFYVGKINMAEGLTGNMFGGQETGGCQATVGWLIRGSNQRPMSGVYWDSYAFWLEDMHRNEDNRIGSATLYVSPYNDVLTNNAHADSLICVGSQVDESQFYDQSSQSSYQTALMAIPFTGPMYLYIWYENSFAEVWGNSGNVIFPTTYKYWYLQGQTTYIQQHAAALNPSTLSESELFQRFWRHFDDPGATT